MRGTSGARLSCLLLLGTGLAAIARAQASDLAGLGEALTHPVVAGTVALSRPIAVGRGEVQPSAGAAVHLLTAGGIPCGLWVVGPATFSYRVEDRFSRPVAERNLKRASELDVTVREDVLVVTALLTEAVIWAWDPLPDDIAGVDAQGPAFSPWAREVLDRSLETNPARDMLLSRFNDRPGYLLALLRSDHGDLLLDVDPRPHVRSEWLQRLRPLGRDAGDLDGRLVPLILVTQPIGRAWWDVPSPPFETVETTIALRNDAGAHTTVEARTRVRALTTGLRVLAFWIPEAVRDHHGRRHPVELKRLLVDGGPGTFRRDRNALLVLLPRALAVGETAVVVTEIEGELAQRPQGDNYWTLEWNVLSPMPADNGRQASSFAITAEVAAPFVPLASGSTLARESPGELQRLTSSLEGPAEGPVVVAGKYQTVTDERDGYTVLVSSYGGRKDAEARRLAQMFSAARQCYEQWFGLPYPYRELDIVEINEWGFGMAPAGVIYITREAFNTPAALNVRVREEERDVAAAASSGINERFFHEVAHGFFPHVVKLDAPEDGWLSESFADYVAAICIQRTSPDRKEGDWRFERALAEWRALAKDAGAGTSIFLANQLAGEDDDLRARRNLLYGKGPFVLHAMRQELARQRGSVEEGDRYFFAFIRAIVRNFAFKPASTRHLVGILGQMTASDWQPWFERYVYGTDLPELK